MLFVSNHSKLPLRLIKLFELWLTKVKGLGRKIYFNGCFFNIKNALISLNIYKAFKTIRIWPFKPTTRKARCNLVNNSWKIKAYEPIGEAFDFKLKRF
jgi:hypothetical protein